MHRYLPIGLLLSLFLVPSASAASLCDPEYDNVTIALGEARLPQGTQQKIVSKVDTARRQSRSSAPNSVKNAIRQLDQALQLLDSNATKDVAPATRTKLRAAISAYSACLTSTPAPQNVQVTVRVTRVGETAGATVSAGKDIEIRVDGDIVGKTKADGSAAVTVPVGEHLFAAVASPDYGATLLIEITPATTILDLVMNGGGDFSIPAALQIDELVDSVIQPTFPSFTARFLDRDGNTIKLKSLRQVEMTSTGGELTDLRTSFTLKNSTGELVCSNVAALRQILADRFGPYELVVAGVDNDDRLYRNRVTFDLGRFRAGGVVNSPTQVAVPLSGISLRLTNDRNGFVFWGTTGANGSLTFPALMPEGVYLVSCSTVYQSIRYFCADAFVLNADRNFSLRLIALAGPAAEPVTPAASTQGQ